MTEENPYAGYSTEALLRHINWDSRAAEVYEARRLHSPSERSVDMLCGVFHAAGVLLTDEQRVRLEDAFNEAVQAKAEERLVLYFGNDH